MMLLGLHANHWKYERTEAPEVSRESRCRERELLLLTSYLLSFAWWHSQPCCTTLSWTRSLYSDWNTSTYSRKDNTYMHCWWTSTCYAADINKIKSCHRLRDRYHSRLLEHHSTRLEHAVHCHYVLSSSPTKQRLLCRCKSGSITTSQQRGNLPHLSWIFKLILTCLQIQ